MTITGIKVRKLLPQGRLRGVVSVTFDNEFAVHDIKVVQGSDRLFVAMPSRRDDNGAFRDIVHPISQEAREKIEREILAAYQDALSAQEAQQDALSAQGSPYAGSGKSENSDTGHGVYLNSGKDTGVYAGRAEPS